MGRNQNKSPALWLPGHDWGCEEQKNWADNKPNNQYVKDSVHFS